MKVTLKYFGQLVDVMGNHEETQEIDVKNSNELLEQMKQNNPISHIPFQLAINDVLIDQEESKKLNDGDVIALLPPYAGG
ncbi:MoaD/ThiS family protein [Leeuwenhoekiella polynyae]|uniref:Molybdopterin converting factor small subunit n=1 Tax=Leeuwenhoekiella polynyae TaxID=1550906 RepID=A0A4Q0P743_9FLAO|nr:MoaD/ThiS family protein [Leeuwenhoekiella polynyae]RXG22261.1 molybdopterin converting factor small subunit [Leeuwenhoekiella polynyae]